MAISFPSSPSLNQTYTVGSKTWIWNGYAWDLQIANTSSLQTDIQSAFTAANSAGSYANSAFNVANSASIAANTPSHVANSASIYANGAFTAANTADSKAVSAGSYANSAFNHANAAFIKANTGGALTVSLTDDSNNFTNVVTSVTGIRFDANSGFDITDLGSGNVKVGMNSTFKTWKITGQQDLIANGLDTIQFVGSNGVVLTSNTLASPKTITFDTSQIFGVANTANTVYVSDAPPNSPKTNTLWWQSNTATLKIYYNDGVTSQWVDTNQTYAVDNVARTSANSAFIHANAAFNAANSAADAWVRNQANSAFESANSAGVYANAAFTTANAAFTTANGTITWNTANAAFIRANNSLDANNGGTISGTTTINANLIVTGSNVSLGNVGNVHIYGGNTGQLLTTDGTGTVSWIDLPTPNTVTYVANTLIQTDGVYVSGNLWSTQVFGDYAQANGAYVLTDGSGITPAWYIDFDFINVIDFNRVVLNINYTQNSGHTIYVQLYNNNSLAWDNIGTYTGLGSYYAFALQVIDSTDYINSGQVLLRLYHSNGGSVSHTTSIDYVALEESYQGPQGPRGPTGSTGATGPAGNGVATGGTTGQVLIKNSATNYDTAWSNNLIDAWNTANSSYVRANNSINANTGGTIDGDVIITGNLVVQGTEFITQTSTLAVMDNMIYLNNPTASTITNAVGNGTYVIYTTQSPHGYEIGLGISVSGVTPSSFNISGSANLSIANVTSNTFTVASSVTDTYVSGGTARARTASNPDLGFAGGYNNGSYAHAGLFRDASDGIWKFFYNYTPEPDTSAYIDTNDPSFRIADLTANIVTDVITVRGNDPLTQANLAFDKANNEAGVNATQNNSIDAAFIAANSSGSYANSAFLAANTADSKAVSAGSYANSAFVTANNEAGVNATQNTNITFAWNHANAAFIQANTGGSGVRIDVYNANTNVFTGTANGTGTTFELGFSPASQNNIIVSSNGIVQYDYTLSTSTLIFNSAPPNGSLIRVQTFGTSQANSLAGIFQTGNLIVYDGNTLVSLANTGSSGTYGNTTHVPVITTDNYGRVISITNTAITGLNASDQYARDTSNSAFIAANSAGIYANGAFAAANNEAGVNATQNTTIQIVWNHANSAYNQANNGGASVSVGDDPPAAPTANSLWWQSNTGELKIYYNDGTSSQWVDAFSSAYSLDQWARDQANAAFIQANTGGGGGASVSVGDSPPGSPTANSLWWQSNTATLKIYYDDGSSSQWVDASPSAYALDEVARNTANAAFITANAAFTTANAAFTTANGTIAWNTANSAFIHANAAFNAANTVNNTGTAAFAAANTSSNTFMIFAVSDENTAITMGGGKTRFRAPFGMTIYQIPRASLNTASSSGDVVVDINENGTSILGVDKLTIDAGEKTSTTAAIPTTLATTTISDDSEITIDIDSAGTDANGLKVTLYFRRT